MTIQIDRSVPATAPRAIGVITARIVPDQFGNQARFVLPDETVIRGAVSPLVKQRLIRDAAHLGELMDVLVYPRTHKRDLMVYAINHELADPDHPNPDSDHFVVSGLNIGSRLDGVSNIAIRTPEGVEKFWLRLHGYLSGDVEKGIYSCEVVRRRSRLYIIESKLVGSLAKRRQVAVKVNSNSNLAKV